MDSTARSSSHLVLVADTLRNPAGRRDLPSPRVRRYRLARMRPAPDGPPADRFAHLRRTHD